MQRIPAVRIGDAPEASKPILKQIKEGMGRVPNIFASVANSPTALEALMGMFWALDKGALAGKAHEAIALRVGEFHGCQYCTAAHTAKAMMAGVPSEETVAFRTGAVDDAKLKALLDFSVCVVEKRGGVSDADVQTVRDAGWSDAELLEALAIVVVNTFTNYVNSLVKTKLDFPAAPAIS